MRVNYQQTLTAFAALAMAALAPLAQGAIVSPVTGWVIHNNPDAPAGSDPAATPAIAAANTNDPALTTADNEIVILGTFDEISLANAGDYVTFDAQLQLIDRTALQGGDNALSTQLRFGVFSGPSGAVGFEDDPNNGFVGQYSNLAAQGNSRLRAQESGNDDPFLNGSLTNVVDGAADAGGDHIEGANPPAISYTMTITRNAGGSLDITGTISGGDYSSTFATTNYNSATFPVGGPFDFNRAGFWFGNNVNATTAQLTDVTVTTNIPEPQTICLAAMAAIGGVAMRSRRRHASSRV